MKPVLKRYTVAIHDKSRTIYVVEAQTGDEAVTMAHMVWQAQCPEAKHTGSFTSWVQCRDIIGMSVTDIQEQRTINTEVAS